MGISKKLKMIKNNEYLIFKMQNKLFSILKVFIFICLINLKISNVYSDINVEPGSSQSFLRDIKGSNDNIIVEDGGTIEVDVGSVSNTITIEGDGGDGFVGSIVISTASTLSGKITLTNDSTIVSNKATIFDVSSGDAIDGSGTLTLNSSAGSMTIEDNINLSSGDLKKINVNDVTLKGVNSYTGQTIITNGSLNVLGSLPDSTNVAVGSAGTYNVNASDTIGSISGAGTISTSTTGTKTLTVGGNGNSTTFDGAITNGSGTLNLVKEGNGTLTLDTVGKSMSGTLDINDGVIAITSSSGIDSDTVEVNTGATLELRDKDFTSTGRIISISGSGHNSLGALYLSSDGSDGAFNNSSIILNDDATISAATGTTFTLRDIDDAPDDNIAVYQQTGENNNLTLSGGGTIIFEDQLSLGTGSLTISAGTTLNTGIANMISDNSAVIISGTYNMLSDSYDDTINSLSGSGTINLGSKSTLTVGNNSSSTEFSGTIDDASAGDNGSIIKTGSASLTLSGTNTYSGSTTINAGTISVASSANLGATPGSADADNIIFNGGTLNTTADFTLGAKKGITMTGAGTIDIDAGTTLTYAGSITDSGTLTKAGTGTLSLSGSSDNSGGILVSAGKIEIGNNASLGTGTITLNGGTLSSDSRTARTLDEAIAISSNSILGDATNTGKITLSGNSTFSGTNTLTANSDIELSGSVDLGSATQTFSVDSGKIATLSGAISSGAISKSGDGSLIISADNDYASGTTVSTGTLRVSGSGDLGTGSLTIGASGTLDLRNTLAVASLEISGAGSGNRITNGDADGTTANLTVSGTSTLNGAVNTDGTQTYSGTTTLGSDVSLTGSTVSLAAISGGTNALAISGNLYLSGAASSLTTLSVSGTSDIGADVTTTGTQSYTGTTTVSASSTLIGTEISAAAIALNDDLEIRNSSNSTLASVISGTGALTKSGSGTLTLRGVNTFDGDLTVSAGTLYAGLAADSGNQVIENNVIVSGGTLSGGATIGGNVTVATANLAPGNSIGTLTIDGNVTLGDNSTTTIEFNDTTSDQVVVSGNITLAGALVLEPANTTYSDATFTIFDGSGGSGNSLSGTFASTTVSNSSYLGDATTSISYDTVNRKVFLNIDEDGGVSSNTVKSLTTRNKFKDIAQIFDDATAGKILEVANVLKSSDSNSVNTELNKTKGTLLANSSLKSVSNHQFYQKALDNIVSANTNSSVSNFTQNNLADLTLDNLQSEGLYGEKTSYNDYYDFSDQSVLGFIKNNKNRTLLSKFSSEDRSSFLRTYGTSSENENIGADYTGYKSDTYGVLFGQQFKDSDKDFYGYAYGFSGTDIDYNNDYGETNAYTLHTSVFKQVSDDDYNLNLKLGGYLTNRQNERKVSIFGTSVNDTYKSETTDLGLQAGATYLRKYNILGLNLSPSISLSSTYEFKDDIDEEGGSLALKVDNENLLTIKPEVGFSLDKNFSTIENITNQFSFAMFASEDHYLEGTTASAKFATGSNFNLDLPRDKDQFLAAGLGYNFLNSESGTSLMANLFYTQNTENDYEGNLFSLTFRKLFGDFGRGRIPAVITEKVDEQKEKVVKIILPKVEKEEETIVDTVRRSLALLFQKEATSYRAYKDIYENFDCKVLEDVRLYQSLMYLSRPQVVNLLEKCDIEDQNTIALVANRLNDIRLNDLTMFEILKKNYYYSLIYLPFITFIAFVILMYELSKKGYFKLRRKP
ncbi:autotransporter-associated beta strand repeat-containing protein [Candidatus Pelagibacter sp.]|nr:autotransporter-associated beta strand repeat-containing protein [Candidatus Pelagibacter sp.]